MNFRIADTFTTSLAKLTGDEQKAVKTTAFDLQLDPSHPGMKFHKLDRAKDKNFWSVRVSRDIRLIVHKTAASMLLCYVDHHDAAYHWAERRKLETHPKTGAAQLVEIRETVQEVAIPVQEVAIPVYVEAVPETAPKPLLFDRLTDDTLLSYGVPPEWLVATKEANEETLFDLTEHLPAEASEALLTLATGGTPIVAQPTEPVSDPFSHPDAQRRFRVMANADELAQALDYPWEKWAVFLHPSQRDIVERNYNGPARVAGTAGTGKTVVALHRAARLARDNPTARVLVATFNEILATSLNQKLRHLLGNQPRVLERIETHSLRQLCERLYRSCCGAAKMVDEGELKQRLVERSRAAQHPLSDSFVWSEWREVVDSWQITSWDDYRDFKRLGRRTRLNESQRQVLWGIFQQVRKALSDAGLLTQATMLARLTDHFATRGAGPYDFIVVDEAQDLTVPELRLLAALAGSQPNGLFFAGDQGQRIFQAPFSWKSLGVDIRGRASTLRINYRTSHQIRFHADRLLPQEVSDVDGNVEDRRGAVSAFDGPDPRIEAFPTPQEEIEAVGRWLSETIAADTPPKEIGIFVRTPAEYPRAEQAVRYANLASKRVDQPGSDRRDAVTIMTMHMAKGLEFRRVIVMACDDEVIPLQERIESVTDDSDLEEVYNTERHLLYVACTRARDHLWVSGVDPASEFLDDLWPHMPAGRVLVAE